jgi:tol-pal system protein YbgF
MTVLVRKSPVVLLLGASLSGCALLQPVDDPVQGRLEQLERRMQVQEQATRNQSLVNVTQQVAAVERQSAENRGRVEMLENSAEATAQRQRQLYADLDARIQALEKALQDRPVTDSGDGEQLLVVGGTDRENYQAAFELLKQQRYDESSTAFKQFLQTFPESELAGNAQYWLAESYYVTEQFAEALAAFTEVTTRYPRSRKLPDALLKIGYCNYEMQSWDAARSALKRAQSEFPESTAARLAGQRLDRMEDEGV